jgi:cytochrome b561
MKPLSPTRYRVAVIALHWLMALGLLLMLGSGVAMANLETLPKAVKFDLFQWHKSLGVLLLLALLVRVGARWWFAAPAMPGHFKPLEVELARLGHRALYFFMLSLPLTGWLMVSSSVYGLPTIVFGWFEWPHLPAVEGNAIAHDFAAWAHTLLAIAFALTLLAHVGAVAKHASVDGTNLLRRMWFTRQP